MPSLLVVICQADGSNGCGKPNQTKDAAACFVPPPFAVSKQSSCANHNGRRKERGMISSWLGLVGVLHTLLGFAASCWHFHASLVELGSGCGQRGMMIWRGFFCSFFPSRLKAANGVSSARHMAKIAQNDRRICGRDGGGRGQEMGPPLL